ncbi:MAG: phage terminase large subunit [Sphingomonadales bacterium]|nr:phage terminase large subunit [Sphingomonadales bacterium]
MATTAGGFRISTSIGGTLTGRGADQIIIDDPLKASDADSEAERTRMHSWYRQTLVSRLNNPAQGRIAVISQRLHLDDLPGRLIEDGAWDELSLPLVEWDRRRIEVLPGRYFERKPGDILHPARFSDSWQKEQRSLMGERDFEAQYNQRPMPAGGALFKLNWLKRYSHPPHGYQVECVVQSWDTAYDIKASNDYSVCTTWAICGTHFYLLDVFRARLEFYELQKKVIELRDNWDASVVIIEAMGSGISLYQNIVRTAPLHWLQGISPQHSKEHRASKQTPKFERGEIHVPAEAAWLEAFEKEYISFPHGKFDDQVDSMVQFLTGVDSGTIMQRAYAARQYLSGQGKIGL